MFRVVENRCRKPSSLFLLPNVLSGGKEKLETLLIFLIVKCSVRWKRDIGPPHYSYSKCSAWWKRDVWKPPQYSLCQMFRVDKKRGRKPPHYSLFQMTSGVEKICMETPSVFFMSNEQCGGKDTKGHPISILYVKWPVWWKRDVWKRPSVFFMSNDQCGGKETYGNHLQFS